jgi:hypothetical protein
LSNIQRRRAARMTSMRSLSYRKRKEDFKNSNAKPMNVFETRH